MLIADYLLSEAPRSAHGITIQERKVGRTTKQGRYTESSLRDRGVTIPSPPAKLLYIVIVSTYYESWSSQSRLLRIPSITSRDGTSTGPQIKDEAWGGDNTAARRVGTVSAWRFMIMLAQALFPALTLAPITRLHQSAATILRIPRRRTITMVPSMPRNDSVRTYVTAREKKATRRSEGG
jgi:hypothetical protein